MCPLKFFNPEPYASFLCNLAQILTWISFHFKNIKMSYICVQDIIYEALMYWALIAWVTFFCSPNEPVINKGPDFPLICADINEEKFLACWSQWSNLIAEPVLQQGMPVVWARWGGDEVKASFAVCPCRDWNTNLAPVALDMEVAIQGNDTHGLLLSWGWHDGLLTHRTPRGKLPEEATDSHSHPQTWSRRFG